MEPSQPSPFNSTRPLMWILILGGILRLLVWLAFMGAEEHIVDAQDYDRLAVGLAESGKYLTPSGELSSLRPPLYAWCVAQSYKLFGIQNYEPVRLAQSLLSLVTVILVYRIGSLVFESARRHAGGWTVLLLSLGIGIQQSHSLRDTIYFSGNLGNLAAGPGHDTLCPGLLGSRRVGTGLGCTDAQYPLAIHACVGGTVAGNRGEARCPKRIMGAGLLLADVCT